MTTVKNKKGHRESPSCACNTYLCHWENYTGEKATVCSKSGCTETNNLVGGHVIKTHHSSKNYQYIVPLCSKHNKFSYTEEFKLNKNVKLAPVTDNSKCKLENIGKAVCSASLRSLHKPPKPPFPMRFR